MITFTWNGIFLLVPKTMEPSYWLSMYFSFLTVQSRALASSWCFSFVWSCRNFLTYFRLLSHLLCGIIMLLDMWISGRFDGMGLILVYALMKAAPFLEGLPRFCLAQQKWLTEFPWISRFTLKVECLLCIITIFIASVGMHEPSFFLPILSSALSAVLWILNYLDYSSNKAIESERQIYELSCMIVLVMF